MGASAPWAGDPRMYATYMQIDTAKDSSSIFEV